VNDHVITIEQVGAPATATVCRTLLRRSDVSLRAKGFIANLMSHDRSYKLNMKALIAQSRDGKDATYSALREAKRLGYVVIRRKRGRDGRFTEVIWSINWSVPLPLRQADAATSSTQRILDRDSRTVATPDATTVREIRRVAVPERLQQVVQTKEQLRLSSIEWEPCVTAHQREALETDLQDLPGDLAQQVADELAGRIETGKVSSCPIKYGRGIAKNARNGPFIPIAGAAVAERRIRRKLAAEAEEQRRAADRTHRARVAAQMADPATQERIREMQRAIKQSAGRPEPGVHGAPEA